MSTKRQVIESFRQKLMERTADSVFTNQFLYSVLMEHAKWLIKRDISSGRIYRNASLFQTLRCMAVEESSVIDPCCPIKTNCKIYRTKNKLPEMWTDNKGPVIREVTSIDGTTRFYVISPLEWQSKRKDPYQKNSSVKYCFPAEGYLWFPEHNPHKINVNGYYTDDLTLIELDCEDCENEGDCVRFLDTEFLVPGHLEAEMFAKALEQVAGITKRLPEDNQIDKNETRRN